jgi:hypothetical protein
MLKLKGEPSCRSKAKETKMAEEAELARLAAVANKSEKMLWALKLES